ncbi:MAG: hypothetical protein WCT18_00575 [Patescibacteria group bacterium]
MKKIIFSYFQIFFAKNRTLFLFLCSLSLVPCFLFFVSPVFSAEPLTEAYIVHSEKDYATYDFAVKANLPIEDLDMEWIVDEKQIFHTPKVRYFFSAGEHVIKVTVRDQYGNVRYDSVKLQINFWSLRNNWFLWALYFLAVVVLCYYFSLKVYYLSRKKKIKGQSRYFMQLLDEHGWLEKAIEKRVKGN